jgi:hypothetical protein
MGGAHGRRASRRRGWRGGGKLAWWREVGAVAGSCEPLGVKPVAAPATAAVLATATSDSKAIRKH